MGQLRSPEGNIVEVPDDQMAGALAAGFKLVSSDAIASDLEQRGVEANATDRGVLGTVNAALSGAASGVTLGASDVVLSSLLSEGERDRWRAERKEHDIAEAGGQLVGMIAPAIASGGSSLARTPAGALARLADRGQAAAKAVGGAKGALMAAGVAGAEGAVQNMGMYLSDVALGDRDLTAEAMAGELGMGFGFGSLAGGAVYGIHGGTMAARRMFASAADGGKAIDDAATAFQRTSDSTITAYDDVAAAARKRLADIDVQIAEAEAMTHRANAELAASKLDAFRAPQPPRAPKPRPPDLPDVGGIPPPIAGQADNAAAKVDEIAPTSAAPEPAPTPTAATTSQPPTPAPEVAPPTTSTAREVPDRVEVVNTGRPSKPVLELHTYRNGSTTPDIRKIAQDEYGNALRSDLDDAIYGSLPDGFNEGTDFSPKVKGASIQSGIPDVGNIRKNSVYVVKPSDIVERGITGNELHPDHLSSIRQAWDEGKRLPPIEIDLTPEGRMLLEDGNHRLMAAAADNRPVVVRFRATGPNYEPQAHFRDITDRIRGELPTSAVDAPSVPSVPDMPSAPAAPQSLEDMLAETARRMEGGESFTRLGAEGKSRQILERERAELADMLSGYETARTAKQSALKGGSKTADDLGDIATDVGEEVVDASKAEDLTDAAVESARAKAGVASHVDEIAAHAKVVDDFERKGAEITEALGDAAPEEAKAAAAAYREAETAADDKAMDRMVRAIDDHADETAHGPVQRSPKERARDAKDAKLEAESQLAALKGEKHEVRRTIKGAEDSAKAARAEVEKAANTIGLGKPANANTAAGGAAGANQAADIGAVLEAAGTIGIPGLPRPSDIPVIGPLLGAYLKFRALKALAGRMTGRVAATGDARAAALAAKTRQRVAVAVDKMLGVVEKGAAKARTPAVAIAEATQHALRDRIFDDGEPDAPKDAKPEQVAATRIREIGAAAANPQAVITAVRKQMRDVTDPALIAAAEKQQLRRIEYLNEVAPKPPPDNPFDKRPWSPSPAQAARFARSYEVARDPVVAFERLEQKCMTPEHAEALRRTAPKLFAMAQARAIERATEMQQSVPYQQRVRMSLLFDVPIDRSMAPETIASLQAAYAQSPANTPQPGQPQAQPPMPPAPSTAAPVDLGRLYASGRSGRI